MQNSIAMRGWTAIVMVLSLLVTSGCVETEDDGVVTDDAVTTGAIPDAEDDAVCDSLARREEACDLDASANGHCAVRFACSKQLWRQEVIEDVYACVETQPCDVADPAMACLSIVGAELEPTTAQLEAESALRSLEGRCDGMIDVAPGQADEIYEIVRSCVRAEDSCDGIGTCVVLSLEALVADVCGQTETI